MPITKPSMVSYADELDFSELMDDLAKDHKNGFIRVTSSSEEGYILYKDGKQVAASYDRFSKSEALEQINSALDNKNTLIEVFDIGPSQVDYLLDLNKPYTIEAGSNVYDVIGELKKTATETSEEPTELTPEVKEPEVTESNKVEGRAENLSETVGSSDKVEPSIDEKPETSLNEQPSLEKPPKEVENDESSISVGLDKSVDDSSIEKVGKSSRADKLEKSLSETTKESGMDEGVNSSPPLGLDESDDDSFKVPEQPVADKPEIPMSEIETGSGSSETPDNFEETPVDRSELLKKYGIKDVQDDDVENLLQSYKGGIIDDDDVERVELVLMNLIKKSVLGIPKIKGTEVMVFLDNYKELSGTINIITEYESQGFLNRIMGQNRTAVNLRRQIINIAEIAIKKSFRQYPEVVDKFEINVEFS